MVSRGIIEEKISPYKFRVRIPTFDRVKEDLVKTATKNLSVATASVPKGILNNLDVGDVVFVAFENDDIGMPVIIGQLYREALTKDLQGPLLNCRILEVKDQAILPTNIKIGSIDYSKLFYLDNVTEDLQSQIDQLKSKILELENK